MTVTLDTKERLERYALDPKDEAIKSLINETKKFKQSKKHQNEELDEKKIRKNHRRKENQLLNQKIRMLKIQVQMNRRQTQRNKRLIKEMISQMTKEEIQIKKILNLKIGNERN